MARKGDFSIIYFISLSSILITAVIFVWQLMSDNANSHIIAKAFFSLMIIGSSILVITLLVQFILFIRYRIMTRETHQRERLIPSIRHSISIRKQKNILKTRKLRTVDSSQRFYNRFGSYERELRLSNQVFPITIDAEVKEISLDSLVYDEEILDERCAVCKLTFISKQVVVFCPNCENLFHKEHLMEWLKQKPNCPVCSYNFETK